MKLFISIIVAASLCCTFAFSAEAQTYTQPLSQEALAQASAYQEYQEELDRLQQHLAKCQDQYYVAKDNFDRQSERCQTVQRRNEEQMFLCRRDIEQAKNNVMSLKSSVAAVKSGIRMDKATMKSRQAAVKSHRKSLKASGQLNRSGDLYIDQMQAEIRTLSQNIDFSRSQVRRTNADIKSENEFIKSSNQRIKNCKSEIRTVRSELKDAKKVLIASKKDLSNAEKLLSTAEKKQHRL